MPLELQARAKEAIKTHLVFGGWDLPEDVENYDQWHDECSEASFAWQYKLEDEDLRALLELFRSSAVRLIT